LGRERKGGSELEEKKQGGKRYMNRKKSSRLPLGSPEGLKTWGEKEKISFYPSRKKEQGAGPATSTRKKRMEGNHLQMRLWDGSKRASALPSIRRKKKSENDFLLPGAIKKWARKQLLGGVKRIKSPLI